MNGWRIALGGAASLLAAPAMAQLAQPTKEFTDTFAAANRSQLCEGDNVRLDALLGELAKNFSINLFALPPPDAAPGAPVTTRAVFWILATARTSPDEAAASGLTPKQFQALNAIRVELADALLWLQSNPDGQAVRIAPGTSLVAPGDRASSDAFVAGLFAPLTGARSADPVRLTCAPASTEPAVQTATTASDGDTPAKAVLAIRGKIDDLAVPRFDPGATTLSKAFEKASQASLAFTDNNEKGETTVAIEAVAGIGVQLTRRDSAFLFGHYVQSTTETDDPADDDDAKDIKAVSFGLLARRSIYARNLFAGSLGVTVYPTFDLAQDARTARARLFLSDIAIDTGGQPLCDFENDIGPLRFNCRLGVFAEVARVYDAGRSIDLATLDDDNYLGGGGELGLSLWLPSLDKLAPLVLSSEYRYMAILDGRLDDPHRWTIALSYTVPKSNLSISLSHVEGANFETFQYENLNKLSIGFKY
jgi:hypothetical protein